MYLNKLMFKKINEEIGDLLTTNSMELERQSDEVLAWKQGDLREIVTKYSPTDMLLKLYLEVIGTERKLDDYELKTLKGDEAGIELEGLDPWDWDICNIMLSEDNVIYYSPRCAVLLKEDSGFLICAEPGFVITNFFEEVFKGW